MPILLPCSAEPTGDVVLGLLEPRIGEELLGLAELDQPAKIEEGGAIGNARGLLQVVGDDDDGGTWPGPRLG
jgi:hypothetical protein